jgi:hypothetical protein
MLSHTALTSIGHVSCFPNARDRCTKNCVLAPTCHHRPNRRFRHAATQNVLFEKRRKKKKEVMPRRGRRLCGPRNEINQKMMTKTQMLARLLIWTWKEIETK